jgi:hypothetical protein
MSDIVHATNVDSQLKNVKTKNKKIGTVMRKRTKNSFFWEGGEVGKSERGMCEEHTGEKEEN